MPNKDGTGPNGEGPKTGRGRGNCGGTSTDSNNDTGCCGNGRGKGRCCGRGQKRNND